MTSPPSDTTKPNTDWRELYDLGFSVIPIRVGSKMPAVPWASYQKRRATPDEILAWQRAGHNAGIVTGEISGIIVLDLDSEGAFGEAERRGLPETLAVGTARGRHVCFRWPGFRVRNKVEIFPGADLRGDGGYVVAVGSIHETGARYEWLADPAWTEIAPAPAWLLENLRARPVIESPTPGSRPTTTRYGLSALDQELTILRNTPRGSRNDQLNRSAFALAQLAAGGEIAGGDARGYLREAAFSIGLDADEVESTIDSGWEAGWREPRSPEREVADTGSRLALVHPVALDLKSLPVSPPPVPFIIPGWLPSNVVTLFSAHGGAGKSFVALYVAVCVAIGRHPFKTDESMPRRRVLFYSAEDGLLHLQGRLRRYLTYLGVPDAGLDGWLMIFDATGSDNVLFRQGKGGCTSTDRFDWLAAKVQDFGADLLIFDNASDALDANENDRAAVRQFMSSLRQIAPTVLMLAHVDAASSMARPRDAKGYSGSTAWHNSARSRWFLTRDDGDMLTLRQPKVNYSRSGSEIMLRWDDEHGVFIVTGSCDRAPDAGHYRALLLRLFADALCEGETISPHRTANNNLFRAIRYREGFPQGLDSAAIYKGLALWKREGLVQAVDYKSSNRQVKQRLELTEAGEAAAALLAQF